MKKIRVKLKRDPYDVLIGRGVLREAGAHIARALKEKPSLCLVVTSAPIREHWGSILQRSLQGAELRSEILEIEDGETRKNLSTLESLLQQFAAKGADRNSVVIALGGGVVGDIAGFSASIYMRGIPAVQVPTTLLAQVDAAIGGKTGVNLSAGKNLVGTFHQPKLVLIDPETLSTLPDREYRAGLFEVIKCGIIRDPKLFEFMEDQASAVLKRDPKALMRIIAAAVRIKADIVAEDEREGDLRRILNFGHTIGHALETDSGYKHFLHGEAVGWGMVAAAEIGVLAGVTSRKIADRIAAVVNTYGPLPPVTSNAQDILRLIQSDKKTRNGVPHFVLVKKIGKTSIVNDVEPTSIKKAVQILRSTATM